MMFFPNTISKIWKDSAMMGSAIFSIIATLMGVAGISLSSIICYSEWWFRLLVIIVSYLLLVVVLQVILRVTVRKGITLNVRGIKVIIRQGNIFKADGWKVIPFNEYFDTTVDDNIISSTTLNGIFINEYVSDLRKLRDVIASADTARSDLKKYEKDKRFAFPLGRIITFEKGYMLLAFSHFNMQNEAHISKPEYEQCLLTMWKEIRRTYANKPVFLPLIGSGITSFKDIPEKSNMDLLKCMICTLRASGENINQPITILLDERVIKDINFYEAKGAI